MAVAILVPSSPTPTLTPTYTPTHTRRYGTRGGARVSDALDALRFALNNPVVALEPTPASYERPTHASTQVCLLQKGGGGGGGVICPTPVRLLVQGATESRPGLFSQYPIVRTSSSSSSSFSIHPSPCFHPRPIGSIARRRGQGSGSVARDNSNGPGLRSTPAGGILSTRHAPRCVGATLVPDWSRPLPCCTRANHEPLSLPSCRMGDAGAVGWRWGSPQRCWRNAGTRSGRLCQRSGGAGGGPRAGGSRRAGGQPPGNARPPRDG